MADLDPRTLRWAARKIEKEAQLTYDARDENPSEDTARWKRLDSAAGALSSFGRFLADEASAIERKRKAKQGGKCRG